MEFLMIIEEAIHLQKIGYVVIGNNPDFTTEDIAKLNVKGKNIIIKTSTGDFTFEVIDLNISNSFAGNPTIGFTLKESDNFEKIRHGDLLYKQF